MVILEIKNIPVGDLRGGCSLREKSTSSDNALLSSIKNNELREPLLVNPLTKRIISGFRRHSALRRLRQLTVVVALPADVVEGCEAVRRHLASGDSYQVAMSARDRFALAQRLRELPRPQQSAFRYDDCIGPAVGLSGAVLQRLRRTERIANDPAEPDSATENARRVLSLMFEALEEPPQGWTSGQSVRQLCEFLRSECPATLAEACASPAEAPSVTGQALGGENTQRRIPAARKRTHSEIRRGVDTISGVCAGLASYSFSGLPAEDAAYIGQELRRSQRALRDIVKSIQGIQND
ncbi:MULTISPECIES: ParB N-terminal domain-containing protein [unclassified Streptomyces]|uniref:ParB N-terminal domain-containing protein n=1 Tax=unclassified Streptomyces TaxID=2593676 RepID=UPI002E186084|nr:MULTISPECIES: ParB N-terminal domain-containing protein [unclassified Streptomyces]